MASGVAEEAALFYCVAKGLPLNRDQLWGAEVWADGSLRDRSLSKEQ